MRPQAGVDLFEQFRAGLFDPSQSMLQSLTIQKLSVLRDPFLTPFLCFVATRLYHPKNQVCVNTQDRPVSGDAVSTELLASGDGNGLLAVDGNGGFLGVQAIGPNAGASIQH